MTKDVTFPKRIIIVGGGVAGSEFGTLIGQKATTPTEVIEIECAPERRFGGWGFQSFPETENTNLAMRKMFLGHQDNQDEILEWAKDVNNRKTWPERYKEMELDPDVIFPRALVQEYVKWRRNNVNNHNVTYTPITSEAIHVTPSECGTTVMVELADGQKITGDRLVMASGSIAVKIPPYIEHLADHERVIPDPLAREGHERRAILPRDAKILVLGTGLTGEEQANILLKNGHSNVTSLSREGKMHYVYPKQQTNKPLELSHRPDFLMAETPEEFQSGLESFYAQYTAKGYTAEDILAAMRPLWEDVRAELGGCVKAVQRLRAFQRTLAINSIGTSFEVAATTRTAIDEGRLTVLRGHIKNVQDEHGKFSVSISDTHDGEVRETQQFDYIINGVGRTIIRHPIWDSLLSEGHAKKHASIGVQVSEHGQMLGADDTPSNLIYVVGMTRAGDHTFRHGFLGNTAFNVPQVRSHVAPTVDALLATLNTATPYAKISMPPVTPAKPR